jgi:6-pyruvoyltetrahydropterin/6-carboxytetrahydropterin synthase
MHGHGFLARVRAEIAFNKANELDLLDGVLENAVAPLNYDVLNSHIEVPTDENIARYVRSRLESTDIDVVGVQSTKDQGVDLDLNDVAHIWRRFRFEAAHQLPNVHPGHPCGRMHGHGFEVVIHARESVVDREMGVDFDQIEALWQPLNDTLNYSCLNHIPGLENPTSELIAKWIWDHLKPKFNDLSWITVYETISAGCHYDGETYRIWKQLRFESALTRHDLQKSDLRHKLHGHSYMARLHLTCDLDALMGWTIDYGDVKELFKTTYDQIDHHSLNELPAIGATDSGSLLNWISQQVSTSLPQMDGIDLFETPLKGTSLFWGEIGRPPLPA